MAERRRFLDEPSKHLQRSSRRNELPVKLINRLLLMRHEHAARSLVEVMQIGKAAAGPDPVFHHAPEAFDGIEVVTTPSRQEMQPKPRLPVGQRRRQLVCAVDATAIDDHNDLFPSGAKEGHHLMDILPKPFGIKLGDDLIEDFRGAILDRAHDAEQHAVGHTAPTPITAPGLAFEGLFTSDLAGAQGPCRHTKALGFAVPPARSRQGKPPQDGFICVEQNNLATLRSVLQGG